MANLIESYKQATPWKWRRAGDFALLLIPAIQLIVGNAPEGTFTKNELYWINSISSLLLLAFKFWTNTRKEDVETTN